MRQYNKTHHAARLGIIGALLVVGGCATSGGPVDPGARVLARWDFASHDDPKLWQPGQGVEITDVRDGVMTLRISHSDAFIFAPEAQAPLDGCAVRIRCRSDHDGGTQVYWRTAKDPAYSERQVVQKQTLGGKDFQTVELVIGWPADAGSTLTGFRIDPFNGPRQGEVEIDWVELVRLPPRFDVSLSTSAAQVPVGAKASLRLTFRQVSGAAARQTIRVTGPEEAALQTCPAEPGTEAKTSFPIVGRRRGVHRYRTMAGPRDGPKLFDVEASMIATAREAPTGKTFIGTNSLRLELLADAEGQTFGAARLWIRSKDKKWRLAGLLNPLAEVGWVSGQGAMTSRHPRFRVVRRQRQAVGLLASVPPMQANATPDKGQIELDLRIDPPSSSLAVNATLRMPAGTRVSKFAGPALLVPAGRDPLDRYGLFGGLEMLAPGWRSSSERAVGERLAERWTPHPFKVALPVMAIEQDGVTTALMWQPMQKWDGEHEMPAATFASPNFIHDQVNHLCQLFVPSLPDWFEENATRAGRPYEMASATPLRLEYRIRAALDEPIVQTAKSWYQVFGAPPPPPAPHDVPKTYHLCAQCYGQTVYWQDDVVTVGERQRKGGWRHHWFLNKESYFSGQIAADLLTHAVSTGRREWIERTQLADGRFVIDVLGSLADHTKHSKQVDEAIASQREDGTWAFVSTKRMIEMTEKFTQGRRHDLGKDGATTVGTCVQPALTILRRALLTGEKKCIDAGVKALEAMKRFRIPRGAQVWEVPLEVPDIRAAALAVEAYRIGYQLTGKRDHLEQARYWAYSGLPFILSWPAPHDRQALFVMTSKDRVNRAEFGAIPAAELYIEPHRQITPYATIPVLGSSFYVVNWFGTVVQWCGMEWAYKVIELGDFLPDPLLRKIAEGVILSGRQQMFDREPMVGLYPDAWPLITNRPGGALICCDLILRGLRAQRAIPSWSNTWTRVVAAPSGRIHVSGWGDPKRCTHADGTLHVEVDFAPTKANELLVARASRPATVRVTGRALQQGAGPTSWRYEPDRKLLFVRFEQPVRLTSVEIAY